MGRGEHASKLCAVTRNEATIVGFGETPYTRTPDRPTAELLAEAAERALAGAGMSVSDLDGLGVSSFSLAPDHAIDLAWRLGIRARWLMEDTNGGAAALNLLQHARRAVEAGDAHAVLLLAGDSIGPDDFGRLTDEYNAATRDHLSPIPTGGPNALFALLTQRQMRTHGLTRDDYGRVVLAQRANAAANPNALYREPLALDEYLAAPVVADPLTRLDCVPIASGADAIVVARGHLGVRIRAFRAAYNHDGQEGDGLRTGLDAGGLWHEAGMHPNEVDVAEIYDDYPAMVLVQLHDLGFGRPRELVDRIASGALRVNTGGGQLSAGQAGAAGGMLGLVEALRRLRDGERTALVTGYGMVTYRYGACANALVLEAHA
jgi:acetyl-CoA acetyltransferase